MMRKLRQWLACRAGRHEWQRWEIPEGAKVYGSRNVYQCQGCGKYQVIEPWEWTEPAKRWLMDQHRRNVTGKGYRPEQRAGEGI